MAEASAGRRALCALLWLVGLGLFALVAGNAWVIFTARNDIVDDVASAPSRPVAIVLGNKVFPDGSVSHEMALRLHVALDLYRAGKVERLFLSGAAIPELGYDEPAAMAGWLERRGVPRAAMMLDRQGFRTAATMADAAAQGLKDVLVCTQWYHLPRSLYLARHAGLRATGVPAAPSGGLLVDRLKSFFREGLARTEIILEVALRGVRPSPS
jgi:vancomycin permeability regulator SanA